MNELTKVDAYKTDLPRLVMLKYQIPVTKKPDVIHYLLNYYHDNEKSKQHKSK